MPAPRMLRADVVCESLRDGGVLRRIVLRRAWIVLGLGGIGSNACGETFLACPPGACAGDAGVSANAGESSGGKSFSGAGGRRGTGGSRENLGGASGGAGNLTSSGGSNLGGACGDACDEEAPHCLESEARCVECRTSEDCADPTRPLCNASHDCVRCKTDNDCKQAFSDRGVCVTTLGSEDFGACIGCQSEDDCDGYICDPKTRLCTEYEPRKKGVCAPCEHDLECKIGQYCVPQIFQGIFIGNYCTQTKEARVGPDGTCSLEGAGFSAEVVLTSVGGVRERFCALARTTCPAYSDHHRVKEGCESETPQGDAACGVPGVDDGLCRKLEGVHFCTYRCLSDADCKTGSTCPQNDEQYCSL